MTPRLSIDPESATPPFEQVRSQLARKISDRTLAVGTRLPTVRALATDLMNEYVRHVGSGLWAVPPGAAPGSYVGAGLFG